ncbi:MAG: type I-C CRISPR-associated protein Cas8c/Csd1 [PVC group bacterium]
MILQALSAYYRRLKEDNNSNIAPRGFEKKRIPFIIILDNKGNFQGIVDTRIGEGNKKIARKYRVPHGVKKSVNIAANLLWDNQAYVFGIPRPDPKKDAERLKKRAVLQHQAFIERIRQTPSIIENEAVSAVFNFLNEGNFRKVFEHPLWEEIEESGGIISFQIEGTNKLVCQIKAVTAAVKNMLDIEDGPKRQCLIDGELNTPIRLHTTIKGIWGAQSVGANIVSFNLYAFNSYEKKQGYNAPIGGESEFAYTTALNELLARDSRQRIQVGDASTIFWAERKHEIEPIFAEIFGVQPKGESDQDNAALRALFTAPKSGAPPVEEDPTSFYVLGLAPNAARIAVRFWYAGTVKEVVASIRQHFLDCAIVHGPKSPEYLSLFRLLVSTAVGGKSENIQSNLAGEVMLSILNGTPYPMSLLSSAVRRARAEREVSYPRAALIKAVLVRKSRYYHKQQKEVDMALDIDNTNIGYLLGRLFAVLERVQESANPGINTTIRDSFYGAASSTPVVVFPRLLKLKCHHIAKLESEGLKIYFERIIGEIMAKADNIPAHLDLSDQGRFAIGYYHQRQDFYTKKEKSSKEKEVNNE